MPIVTEGELKRLSDLMAGQEKDSVDINGGAIDGVVIGGSTPAAGSFTTATLTDVLTLEAATLASAGTDQATAAAIASQVVNVTGADGTKAVRLPAATAGVSYLVYNSVATNGLPIFPATSGTINGGSANAAITIEGKTLAVLVATDDTNWAAIYTANT